MFQVLFVCGVSVSISIRDFASVPVVQGDWMPLWVELSLVLLMWDVWILGIIDGYSSTGCSGDFPLEAGLSDKDISGFRKKISNPWGVLWFETKICFNNSYSTYSMASLSMIVLSISWSTHE